MLDIYAIGKMKHFTDFSLANIKIFAVSRMNLETFVTSRALYFKENRQGLTILTVLKII